MQRVNGRKLTLAAAALAAFVAPTLASIADRSEPNGNGRSTALVQSASGSAFEVASIKLNTSNKPPLTAGHLSFLRFVAKDSSRNGRFTMEGFAATPLSVLIQLAYGVRDVQLSGGPAWVASDRYDVSARADGPARFEEMRPMLRSLLADRFKLQLRRETKDLPVFELVASDRGLKITAMKEDGCADQQKFLGPLNVCGGVRRQSTPQGQVLEAVGITTATLAELLSDSVGRIVIDKTGFTESFSVRLEFTNSAMNPSVDSAPSASSAPSLFAALEEQLGMRLRAATGPVEAFVIDRVERPSEN
jgi:uncharacterized protein (TIGR03435 family)